MIDRIDHVVLTTKDEKATIAFYTEVLGFTFEIFQKTRKALRKENFKINVHTQDEEILLKAAVPTPGSLDLCFITEKSIHKVKKHLEACKVPILEGPVKRTGALGKMMSIYFRDPDGNLLEVSSYEEIS